MIDCVVNKDFDGTPQEKSNVAVYPKDFFSPFSYIKGFGRITAASVLMDVLLQMSPIIKKQFKAQISNKKGQYGKDHSIYTNI